MLLRHVLRTFDFTILLMVALLSLFLALAIHAGLFGIVLGLTCFSWFFKYAYVLLEDVAHGVDQPPVMSVEMVNPVSQRPAAQVLIGVIACTLIFYTDGAVRIALLAFFVVSLPASVAILGTGNLLQAINPWALARTMFALGRYYVGILVAVGLVAALFAWLISAPLWLIGKFAIAQLAILLLFNLIGGALYERRDALDLDVMHSPEKELEREEERRLRERNRVVDDIYTQARVRKYAAGDAILKQWLDARSTAELALDAPFFVTSAIAWDDSRALARIAAPSILRLHAARLTIEALDTFESTLNCDAQFQLGSVQACVELAELAKAAGRRGLARKIVATCTNAADSSLDIVNRLAKLRTDLER